MGTLTVTGGKGDGGKGKSGDVWCEIGSYSVQKRSRETRRQIMEYGGSRRLYWILGSRWGLMVQVKMLVVD